MDKKYELTCVTAFIKWEDKVLIALRAEDDTFLPGYWEQVGGKVDPGETLEEAIVREVKEEAGIDVKPVSLYNEFEYYHHRDGRFMCEFAYICALNEKPEVRLSVEHQDYKWVDMDELEDFAPMTEYMRDVIKKGFRMNII